MSRTPIDITGQRFGRLVVLDQVTKYTDDPRYKQRPTWRCLCDCGNETFVFGTNLRGGNTKSCGCLQKEAVRNRTKAEIV